MGINLDETEDRPQIEFPKESYTLRINRAEMADSKKGNRMIVVTTEIISPDSIISKHDKKRYPIAGTLITHRVTILPDNLGFLKSFYKGAGIPTTNVDIDNPDVDSMVGKKFKAIVESERYDHKSDETGEILKDGDGKPLTVFKPVISRFLGPVE